MRFGQRQDLLWGYHEIREAASLWHTFPCRSGECHGAIPERSQAMTKLITPGELAPDFELKDIKGKLIRLSDFRGKAVVISFLRGFM